MGMQTDSLLTITRLPEISVAGWLLACAILGRERQCAIVEQLDFEVRSMLARQATDTAHAVGQIVDLLLALT